MTSKYKPAKSVMTRVKEFMEANQTFWFDGVCSANPDVPRNQIQTALWKLRNAGNISRHEDGTYTVLTGVNAPAPEAKTKPKTKTKAKAKVTPQPQATHEVSPDAKYKALADRWTILYQQHEDALAIIRYLENKLYVALQQVAKRG